MMGFQSSLYRSVRGGSETLSCKRHITIHSMFLEVHLEGDLILIDHLAALFGNLV